MRRPVTRVPPQGPAAAYKTYQVTSPLSTHFRPARCSEVDCPNMTNGWRTVIDETTDFGRRQAAYIRSECRPAGVELATHLGHVRRYVETREGGLTVFAFPAGQECFAEHEVPLERPEVYVVRGGDWRGDPTRTPVRRHVRAEDWVEDFAEHQARLHDRIHRG